MAAGFVDFAVVARYDVFAGAQQASSASEFGTLGITFRARRARNEAEWLGALAEMNCELPGTMSGDRD